MATVKIISHVFNGCNEVHVEARQVFLVDQGAKVVVFRLLAVIAIWQYKHFYTEDASSNWQDWCSFPITPITQ